MFPVGRFDDFVMGARKFFRPAKCPDLHAAARSVGCLPRDPLGIIANGPVFNCAAGPGSDGKGDRKKSGRGMQTPELRVKSANLPPRPIEAQMVSTGGLHVRGLARRPMGIAPLCSMCG